MSDLLKRLRAHKGTAYKNENDAAREIERLRAELAANARMLARQCDLARAAEAERDSLRGELTDAVAALQLLYDWRAPDTCAPDYVSTRSAVTKAEKVLETQPRPDTDPYLDVQPCSPDECACEINDPDFEVHDPMEERDA